MRVVIITDRLFAAREQPLLARLEIGLVDEGVRVVHCVPQDRLGHEAVGLHSPVIGYADRGLPFTRTIRARQLLLSVANAFTIDPEQRGWLDVVHCFGGSAIPLAVELAKLTDASLAFDLWRPGVIRRLKSLFTPAPSDLQPPILLAPDLAVRRAARKAIPSATVELTPWGVHARRQQRPPITPDRPVAVAVLASGHDRASLRAFCDGVARLPAGLPEVHLFINDDVAHTSSLVRHINKLGLTERMTLVPDMENRREPVLLADVLVQPEALGEHHTLTLDAMAVGIPVIALADPLVEYLVDDKTARLVASPTPDLWTLALTAILSDADAREKLVDSAYEYAKKERPTSNYIAAVLRAYDELVRARLAIVEARSARAEAPTTLAQLPSSMSDGAGGAGGGPRR